MNGYSSEVAKLSDRELNQAIENCSRNWWDYGNPATDKYWYYKALLEEEQIRKHTLHQETNHAKRTLGLY